MSGTDIQNPKMDSVQMSMLFTFTVLNTCQIRPEISSSNVSIVGAYIITPNEATNMEGYRNHLARIGNEGGHLLYTALLALTTYK